MGCNESMTLHSWKSAGAGWDTGEVTLVNTDVFLNAFEQIRKDGRYAKWDWTVKADPDCVFFANAAECKQYLGTDSGEDGFFKSCMDALGVGYMTDTNIFTPDYDPSACRNGERVAFHPIKH